MNVRLLSVVILMMFLIVSCAGTRMPNNMNSTEGLGDELKFPDGWKLITMSQHKDSYSFICERDGVYRFCTPTIER